VGHPAVNAARPRLSYYSFDSLKNPWVGGGGARRDFEVLKRLAARFDVTLYLARYPGFDPSLYEGMRVRALGGGGSNAVSRLAFTIAANLRILFDRADFIGNSYSAYAPLLAGLLRPRRFFAVVHHRVGEDAVKKYGFAGRLSMALESLFFRRIGRIAVSNRTLADRVRKHNPRCDVLLTSNSIDGVLLSLPVRVAAPPFILFLGRFDIHMKGLDLLLSAYRSVSARGPAPRLVMAGAGSPEAVQALRRLVPPECASSVDIRPNVDEAEKRELLSTCLFFCSPSRFEGFGIAALEANAAGKAVLVTDTDGFRDSVSRDRTSIFVPPGDVAALENAIRELTENDEKRNALGEAGRRWAGKFSWDAVAKAEADWIEGKEGYT
jgi:glycosyltransferase involved in cell wall biosynthesis